MANCFGCRHGTYCTIWDKNEGDCTEFEGPAMFELSVAWQEDDEFEHEGYFDDVDSIIEYLLKYKKENCC